MMNIKTLGKITLLLLALSCSLMGKAADAADCDAEKEMRTAQEGSDARLDSIGCVMMGELGETLSSLLLHADSIVAQVVTWEQEEIPARTLPSWMCLLTQYTWCSPALYQTDKKVYSQFDPYVALVFIRGGEKATLLLDYSINKWLLKDGEGQVVCRHDLLDKALLPMFRLLFPESETLKLKYDEYVQKHHNEENTAGGTAGM